MLGYLGIHLGSIRRLLGVLWTARRSNQSILKEMNPEYSLEGLMLKLQYFGHWMQRADSLEKTLILGKTEGKRRMGGVQRMRWLDSISNSMNTNLSKLWETVEDRGSWHGVAEWEMTWSLNSKLTMGDHTIYSNATSTCIHVMELSGGLHSEKFGYSSCHV